VGLTEGGQGPQRADPLGGPRVAETVERGREMFHEPRLAASP
jgi:hypothetical protein